MMRYLFTSEWDWGWIYWTISCHAHLNLDFIRYEEILYCNRNDLTRIAFNYFDFISKRSNTFWISKYEITNESFRFPRLFSSILSYIKQRVESSFVLKRSYDQRMHSTNIFFKYFPSTENQIYHLIMNYFRKK